MRKRLTTVVVVAADDPASVNAAERDVRGMSSLGLGRAQRGAVIEVEKAVEARASDRRVPCSMTLQASGRQDFTPKPNGAASAPDRQ